jgi:DNA polymerase
VETQRAEPPHTKSVAELRKAAAGCRACPLWEDATQTVFGAGATKARVMLVGEQPGDQEDRQGLPFVGPAGAVLRRAIDAAELALDELYVTNVVKHFKWKARGPRRIHDTPNEREVAACSPWLHAEIDLVRPGALVCLGATASRALLGRGFRLTRERGAFVESDLAPLVTATIHPSAILRGPKEDRDATFQGLVDDLTMVRRAVRTAA